MNPSAELDGNVALAIWETTEALVLGRACISTASEETPRKKRNRDDSEDDERARGVPCLRVAEGMDAVRDRLDAGKRSRARREGAQQHEDRDRTCARRDGIGDGRLRDRLPIVHSVRPTPIMTT